MGSPPRPLAKLIYRSPRKGVRRGGQIAAMGQDKYQGLVNPGKNHFNVIGTDQHEDRTILPIAGMFHSRALAERTLKEQ